MHLIIEVFAGFVSLIWLGLMLVNLPGAKKKPDYTKNNGFNPKVLVMLPCKGADLTLDSNIKSLKNQDYKNFTMVAIVDSKDDEAVKSLESNMVDYIIAGNNCIGCSGKVRALSTAYEEFKGFDVYVIADSDVEAKPDWLSRLVEPLADESVGISTTFPIFVPKAGFWSRVKMVWGFVGDGMMESNITRFGWGGSLAFRKDLLTGDAYENFKHSISDDIAITTAAKKLGLKIAYVKKRVAAVNSGDDFKALWEWANRQTALSVIGNRRVLRIGIAVYSMDILLLLSAIALSIFYSSLFVFLFAPFAIGIAKTYKRANGYASWDLWAIYLFINFMYLANLIKASGMKSISWRGRQYELKA